MSQQHPLNPLHQERLLLFQALFMMDVGGLKVREALDALRDFAKGPPRSYDYVDRELKELQPRLPEIDALIVKHTQNWSFERLARVERNLLRLGTYELMLNREPFQVLISEIIDLAKEFGDAKSGGFVNGVLDAVWRTVSAPSETPSNDGISPLRGSEGVNVPE